MLQRFISEDKLATLDEIRYLLSQFQDGKKSMDWRNLSTLCKERSFNFALSFENTMRFLEGVSVLQVDSSKRITILSLESNDLQGDRDYGLFLFQKTCDQLEADGVFQNIFTEEVLSVGEDIVVNAGIISKKFAFIKLFLLNIGFVSQLKSSGSLIIRGEFSDVLRRKIPSRYFQKNQNNNSQSRPSKKTVLYISYSQVDRDYMVKLKAHLSGLITNEIIESHDDGRILPGDDWDKRNREMLERSQVILFLVSAHLMASEYINRVEIPIALERQEKGYAKIIPVLVHPCDHKNLPIGRFQAIPVGEKAISTWINPHEAFLNVVDQIKRVL